MHRFSMSKVSETSYYWEVLPGPVVVIAAMVWPILVCIVTFTLFFVYHPYATDEVKSVEQIPTISGTGQLLPESVIFTYGLHLEAILVAMLFVLVYSRFDFQIRSFPADESLNARVAGSLAVSGRSEVEKWKFFVRGCCGSTEQRATDAEYLRFWNKVLLALGLLCAFFMSLTGSVSLSVSDPAHAAFAVIMFVLATLHLVLFYFTIAEAMGQQPYQSALHKACLVVVVPFNVFMIVVLSVMWVYCTAQACIATAVDAVVVLEYTTTLAFIAYIYRFYDVVKPVSLGGHVSAVNETANLELNVVREPGQAEQLEETKQASPPRSQEGEAVTPYSPPPQQQRRRRVTIAKPCEAEQVYLQHRHKQEAGLGWEEGDMKDGEVKV
jgi:hypothetical protein